LKRLLTYILIFTFAINICSKLGLVAWFKLNQSEITTLFCINKSNPSLNCAGKCYLKSKITALENTQTNSGIPQHQKKVATEEVFIFVQHNASLNPNWFVITLQSNATNFYSTLISNSIFRPPQV